MNERITFREFRMWLDGLLSANEDRKQLPSLTQWQAVLAMLDRVDALPTQTLAQEADRYRVHTWTAGGLGPMTSGGTFTGGNT